VLPIADRHLDYARETAARLREAGLRVEVDERSESIGKKIREAEVLKVPHMLVVGDQEQEAGAVAVRRHREGDQGSEPVAEFARRVADEIADRR
jgi:threonyl-tRNA synthetase